MGTKPSTTTAQLPTRSSAALIIFAKAPVPGQVKTRLCPPLTPDESASLHGTFVLDVLERSAAAAGRGLPKGASPRFSRIVACAPASTHVFFKVLQERHGVHLIDQVGPDLGARMHRAFVEAFDRGHRPVVVVGTDVPTLPETRYTEAFAALSDHDLVLGPALDGGYYLIGLTRPVPELFRDVAWSTSEVCRRTEEKARALGFRIALLPGMRDIDTIQDLEATIAACGLDTPGRTKAAAPLVSARTAGALRLIASRLKERRSSRGEG
ncbi:TIGR04282 family arsenosugar biosynthesis glycosyltransferase [Candidatus Nitrospira bockiana]